MSLNSEFCAVKTHRIIGTFFKKFVLYGEREVKGERKGKRKRETEIFTYLSNCSNISNMKVT